MYFHVQVVLAYHWKQQLEPAAKPAHYEVGGREAELSLGPLPEIKGDGSSGSEAETQKHEL